MMSCRELTELASDYLDGRLSTPARLRVRLHLLMCNACRRYIAQVHAVIGALGRLGPPERPSDDTLRALQNHRASLHGIDTR